LIPVSGPKYRLRANKFKQVALVKSLQRGFHRVINRRATSPTLQATRQYILIFFPRLQVSIQSIDSVYYPVASRGIEFSDLNGRITLQDFADNDNDDDSNASDEDFTIDEDYKDKVTDEVALEVEDGSVVNNDPDLQEDYFQTPIQQHNNDVFNNNEPISEIIPKSKRGANPVVALNSIITPGTKKNKQRKKSNIEDYNTIVEEDLDDADMVNTEDTKLGVEPKVNTDNDDDDDDNVIDNDVPSIPHELESDLGPYWMLTQSTYNYVLNTITSYSNIEASKSTP
jgi:hypothetical protein